MDWRMTEVVENCLYDSTKLWYYYMLVNYEMTEGR